MVPSFVRIPDPVESRIMVLPSESVRTALSEPAFISLLVVRAIGFSFVVG